MFNRVGNRRKICPNDVGDEDIAKLDKVAGVRLETAVLSPYARQEVLKEALQWTRHQVKKGRFAHFSRKKMRGLRPRNQTPVGRSVALVNSNKQSHKAFCKSNWPCVIC
jgi:hypothetical protein